MYSLSQIIVYPVKSLAGISLSTSSVEMRGLQYDRRWMLIDADRQGITQRTVPQMALFEVALTDSHLHLSHPQAPSIEVPLSPPLHAPISVNIWEDECLALPVSAQVDTWFSELLGQPLRLVYMPDSTHRWLQKARVPEGTAVSFADAYPFLLIGQASLEDLNRRLDQAVGFERFRPNLIVSGSDAYAEDLWEHVSIGEVRLKGIKPCKRCVLVTVDPEKGTKGAEPLKTLSTYRRKDKHVLFGQNFIWESGETLKVGDAVQLHSYLTQK